MMDTQSLAMLALRRLHARIAISADVGAHSNDDSEGEAADPAALTGGDRVALGRILRRAMERTWLTLELLFCKDAIAPRLGRNGTQTLDAIFSSPCFEQLNSIPAPFRKTIWRELHAARKGGPLAHGEVDMDGLIRQLSSLTRQADPRALQDLEWYALWQMAGNLAHDGYRELRSLFEARSTGGESLLIGLVTSFIPFELDLEGNPARGDLGLCILPAEHIRWLCEQSEPIEVFLNETYSGGRGAAPAESTSRVRQGLLYAQQGEYERAVIEYTAAIQSDITTAAPFVHRGDALRLRGEYERSLADYSQALQIEPNSLLARLNRGLVYRMTGRPEPAIADFTEALRLDPRNVVAFNGRGGAHSDLGRFALAIADHTSAIRVDPSLAWAYQSRADAYAGQKEYDRAVTDYTQALRLNPHFALAHANRGDSYRLLGDLARAANDYTEALRLDPLNPRMFTSRGDTYRRQGRYDLALSDYGEAIRLDPTNPLVYLNRGIAHQLAGNYDQAVASFDQAEQFDAANPEVFLRRAQAYQDQRSFEAAIADLGRVIELNPRDAVAYISRGSLYALTKQFDKAIEDFGEAARLDPTSAQALLERGRVLALVGNFEEALEDCAAALRLDPQFVPALLIRGGVYIKTGEYASALLEFNQAIRINPRYARAYNDRAVAYSKLGQLDDAIRDFSRSLQLIPANAQALSNRGNAYLIQGKHSEALADFSQAVDLEPKYASGYSMLRGHVEVAKGNYRQAIADYAVALALDPFNRAARTAQAETREKLDSDFEVAQPVEVVTTKSRPAAKAAEPERGPATESVAEIADLSDCLVEEEAIAPARKAAERTHLAMPAAGADVTQVAEVSPEDRTQYEAEQKKFAEAQEAARIRALEERAAELRRQYMLTEANKKVEAAKKPARREKLDPEEQAERRKKIRNYAVIAAGLLVVTYYGGPLALSLIPASKNPYKELAAVKFVEEYTKDAGAADDKFADKTIVIRGKVKIVRSAPPRRGVVPPPPKIFFELPEGEKLIVECLFDDQDIAQEIKADVEYCIAGKVQKFKPGTPITLKQAQIREGPVGVAAFPEPKSWAGLNGGITKRTTEDIRNRELLQLAVEPSPNPHTPKIEHLAHPRRMGSVVFFHHARSDT